MYLLPEISISYRGRSKKSVTHSGEAQGEHTSISCRVSLPVAASDSTPFPSLTEGGGGRLDAPLASSHGPLSRKEEAALKYQWNSSKILKI